MGKAGQGRIRDVISAIAAIALVALTVYALIKALDDQESPDIILAAFCGACLAGLIGLAMWLLERRDRHRAAGEEAARAAENERHRQEAEHRAQQAEQAREQAEQGRQQAEQQQEER